MALKINGKTLITLREASKRYGISVDTLSRAVRMGTLFALRVGKYCLVEPQAVIEWKQKHYNREMAERVKKRWQRKKPKTKGLKDN